MTIRSRIQAAAASLMLALLPILAVAQTPMTIAVMGFEILDDTREYNTPELLAAQDKRLQSIGDQLRAALAERKLYRVADPQATAAVGRTISANQNLLGCNGCIEDIGAALKVDRVAICWVQKVSNLILNINLEVFDARTGQSIFTKSVDIRGNTDESWLRGVRRLVDGIEEKRQHLK